jgi:hypothetical protein
MKLRTQTIESQKSWVVESDQIRLALTEVGGHMAPVTFFRNGKKPIEPYYVSPWQGEGLSPRPPVLGPLRGDFFCLPFGADSTVRGVDHTTHGEPATRKWSLVDAAEGGGSALIELEMKTKKIPGKVTKRIQMVAGQNVLYITHALEGYTGRTSLGHHATLAPPPEAGSMHISTSPILFGMTDPAGRAYGDEEYSALQPGTTFRTLTRVPTRWKADPTTDCTVFPTREGFCDILQIYARPGKSPAWTAAAVPSKGYLWFSLKDAGVLSSTVFWMENRGRHGAPWNGRTLCIGLEEVCSFMAAGLAQSTRKNPVSEKGVATSTTLSKRKPLLVNVIQGVVPISRTFDFVKSVRFRKGQMELISRSGKTAKVVLDHEFIKTGQVRG